jgi:hypothetical protein
MPTSPVEGRHEPMSVGRRAEFQTSIRHTAVSQKSAGASGEVSDRQKIISTSARRLAPVANKISQRVEGREHGDRDVRRRLLAKGDRQNRSRDPLSAERSR